MRANICQLNEAILPPGRDRNQYVSWSEAQEGAQGTRKMLDHSNGVPQSQPAGNPASAPSKPGRGGRRGDYDSPERRKKLARSRISNGVDLLPGIDGRSLVARRYRDIANAILADQSGSDQCSEARRQLIRRFAAASVIAEQLESRLANGETISIVEHSTLSSTLVRLAARIGIDRVPRDVTPSVSDYIAAISKTSTIDDEIVETSDADDGDAS